MSVGERPMSDRRFFSCATPSTQSSRMLVSPNSIKAALPLLPLARTATRSLADSTAGARRLFVAGSRGIPAGRVDRDRKLSDVTSLDIGDLADSLLLYLVNANDRVHWQECAFDVGELRLDSLLGRIDQYRRPFTKDEILNLDKTEHLAMMNLARIDFVNLSLVCEDHPVDVLFSHHCLCESRRGQRLPQPNGGRFPARAITPARLSYQNRYSSRPHHCQSSPSLGSRLVIWVA